VAVVVEKPFTSTSEEADRIIALAKEKKLILTPFQSEQKSFVDMCTKADTFQIGDLTATSKPCSIWSRKVYWAT